MERYDADKPMCQDDYEWLTGGYEDQKAGKQVKEYQWEDVGIDHGQYFQGVSLAFTPYTHVYVGACDDWSAAAEDAVEQASEDGWNVDGIPLPAWGNDSHIKATSVQAWLSSLEEEREGVDDFYYFVALYLKGE